MGGTSLSLSLYECKQKGRNNNIMIIGHSVFFSFLAAGAWLVVYETSGYAGQAK